MLAQSSRLGKWATFCYVMDKIQAALDACPPLWWAEAGWRAWG